MGKEKEACWSSMHGPLHHSLAPCLCLLLPLPAPEPSAASLGLSAEQPAFQLGTEASRTGPGGLARLELV